MILAKVNRFSRTLRPDEGDRTIFSSGTVLLNGLYPEVSPHQPNLMKCRRCKVIVNRKYVVEVLFDGMKENDLVSPEFLLPIKFSRAEKEVRKILLTKLMKGKKG